MEFFLFAIASLVGIDVVPDSYFKRCVDDRTRKLSTEYTDLCGGTVQCPAGFHCTTDWTNGDTSYAMDVLFNDDARDYCFTGFQNILSAFLTVFQCSTMEGWTDIMYRYQNASSQVFAMVFFVMVMVLGSTFFVNLSVAILWEKYESNENKRKNGEEEVEDGGTGPSVADVLITDDGEEEEDFHSRITQVE